MFKLLKDKLTGWFKKETKESSVPKSERSDQTSQKNKKEKTKSTKTNKSDNKSLDTIKTNIEEEKKDEGFFAKLIKKISTSKLKNEEFDELFSEFEIILLENNVALEVVDSIKESLKADLVGKQFDKKSASVKILEALKNSIDKILIDGFDVKERIKQKDGIFVILFFGINGGGKTTTIAKLANSLKNKGLDCVLAAADTFRAASIEQLEEHARKLNIDIVKGAYGRDPAAVCHDAIHYAKKHNKKVVLIDTAGRMYTKTNLMKEMEKIVRVAKPDLKIFVGESIAGNDAIEQARIFNDTAGIDGIILTKADVDEKAGTILSVSYVTKKPILFLGTGQNYQDLQPFKKEDIFKNLGLE